MLKAIITGAVITAVTVFAYFRGWLPVHSRTPANVDGAHFAPNEPGGTPGSTAATPGTHPTQPAGARTSDAKGGLALFQLGDYEAAIPELVKDLEKNKTSNALHSALATSYEKTGRSAEALAQWAKLAEACPKAPERASAVARVYLGSEGVARVDAGMRLLRDHPESAEAAANVIAIADACDKNGRPVEAWEACTLAVNLGAGTETALVTRCLAYADALAFSGKDVPELGSVYVVKSGDLVQNIAKKNKIDSGVICRVNKLQNAMIRQGQRLKVLTCKSTIEVSIKKMWLRLYYNGKFLARQYPVCTGNLEESPTPIGDFSVSTKLVNPEWTRAGTQAVAADDPANPLGTRWMGFAEPGFTSYGIHGTRKPETIGTHASNGCVRMRNENVEELFDLVPAGTAIHIHE
ncbi:MAG: L,D-transpeptidase family protein [Planctomycetes bacterium]|nr:L,D-transpeptidase family protein [Planctomycetota bacterium]